MNMNFLVSLSPLPTVALTLCLPGFVFARIPEHPAEVDISRLASSATTIFRGRVSNIVSGQTTNAGTTVIAINGAVAEFAVDRWYRGTRSATVNIPFSYSMQMSINGHDCLKFQPGSYWVVFAKTNGGSLQMVDDCEGALAVSPRLASQADNTNNWRSAMIADFAEGLQDDTTQARITSLQRLGNLRSRQILPFLGPLLKAKGGEEYEWAVYAALRAGDIEVLSAVQELLREYPKQHLPELFMPFEIEHITDRAAIPDLLNILRSDSQARMAAIIALSQIGDRRVLHEIAPHLADSDRFVRYQVLAAIQKLLPSSPCAVSVSSSEEEINAREQKCLSWWQQIGEDMIRQDLRPRL
jgi:hypothetical protein